MVGSNLPFHQSFMSLLNRDNGPSWTLYLLETTLPRKLFIYCNLVSADVICQLTVKRHFRALIYYPARLIRLIIFAFVGLVISFCSHYNLVLIDEQEQRSRKSSRMKNVFCLFFIYLNRCMQCNNSNCT